MNEEDEKSTRSLLTGLSSEKMKTKTRLMMMPAMGAIALSSSARLIADVSKIRRTHSARRTFDSEGEDVQ